MLVGGEKEQDMRVIAGTMRRMQLATPSGNDTRPTQDRIKETLFNIIQAAVPGSVFVDVCAGSGGIGIEALSRGAVRAYFIENNKNAVACIQENLHKTHFEEEGTLLKQDAVSALRHIREKEVDLIYVDPPYESPVVRDILSALSAMDYVTENTQIIVETSLTSDFTFLEDLQLFITREKRYKGQRHLFIAKKDGSSDL